IKITENEGIQPDFSFHQHGAQLYSFGYGKAFIMRAVSYAYLAKGTAWEFKKEKIDILSHFLFDGQQWMSRNQFFDYNAQGREITREKFAIYPLVLACEMLNEIDTEHRTAYKDFESQLTCGRRTEPIIGNHNFYRSDFMVHQRPNYYFSIRGTSNRIIGGESGNGENQKGYYLGKGNTFLVRRGDEYKDIFPVWNWRKLPGTIIEQSNEPLPLFDWGKGNTGKTSFVYGVSDGIYGCFGYDYVYDNIKAKRAWFIFDKEIVCMVAGLTSNGDNDFFQSINQCLSKGEVQVDNEILTSETQQSKTVNWVWHDSIAYYSKNVETNLQIQNNIQTGSWKTIDTNGRADTIQKKVFTLGMKIGKHEKNKSFFYAMLPGVGTNDLKNYCFEKNIKILRNDSTVQAVYNKELGQIQAVFYHPNQIHLPWQRLKLNVLKPCLLIVNKKQNILEIHFSQTSSNNMVIVDISKIMNFKNENIYIVR
ncbi:MAG: polysaccharide lyase family 8 super-sandwich domain-containing protein, partial [Bacteroidales bacterium]